MGMTVRLTASTSNKGFQIDVLNNDWLVSFFLTKQVALKWCIGVCAADSHFVLLSTAA
jgi:hypothetical protein